MPFSEPEANWWLIDDDGLNFKSVTFSSASCLKMDTVLDSALILKSMSLIMPSCPPLIKVFVSWGWKCIFFIALSWYLNDCSRMILLSVTYNLLSSPFDPQDTTRLSNFFYQFRISKHCNLQHCLYLFYHLFLTNLYP